MTDLIYDGYTIKELLEVIVGKYEPNLSPTGEVLGGIYSIDFAYICGVLVLCIVLFLVFKAFFIALHELLNSFGSSWRW